MFTYVLLSASGGESSINNDDNEVIGSIDINDEDPSSIEEWDSGMTLNTVDSNGNTVSCDGSKIEFYDNSFTCPGAE